jgi:hypothetical protein
LLCPHATPQRKERTMSDTRASHLPLDAAFTVLVYPFQHTLSEPDRPQRLRALDGAWRPWLARMDDAARATALDDTYFFLPYVRELLFPETARLPGTDGPGQVAQADWVLKETLSRFAAQVPESAVLRLTYDPARLRALRSARLVFEAKDPAGQFDAPFEVEWVDAVLFPQGMGFLALKVRLLDERPTVGRWNDFLYHLHLVHPPKLEWRLATWRLADGRLSCAGRDLVDFFLQGLTRGDQLRPTLDDFLPYVRRVSDRARYTGTPNGQVYGSVFHLFTYGCLGSAAAPAPPAAADPAADLFPSPTRRALYELATCTRSEDPNYVPHGSAVEALWRDNLIALWDNWQALALRDNVVFLGLGGGDFARSVLPQNVESDYFQLYLLVLFQRTRMSVIFGDLVHKEENLRANLRSIRRLWDQFVTFQNLYWYRDPTRKPQGSMLYRRFQQGLEVLPLYEEALEHSRELKAYYEGKSQRRTNSLLFFLTIVGLPVQALVGNVAKSLFDNRQWWAFGLGLAALPLVLYGLWRVWEQVRGE